MQMLKMCLNWKVLGGPAAVGVGIYLVAPDLAVAALPILLLAACPISMVLMMWSMQHGHQCQGQGKQTPEEPAVGLAREERIAQPRTQQATLAEQLGALEQEGAHPAENGRRR